MKICSKCKRKTIESRMSTVMYRFAAVCVDCSLEKTAMKVENKLHRQRAFVVMFNEEMGV